MTNELNPALPVVQRSSGKSTALGERTKVIALALCLSIIPALGITVTSYHWANMAVTKQVAQTQLDKAEISSVLQKQLLLPLMLLGGVSAVLAGAIAALLAHRLSLQAIKPQSAKVLLLGDIASQSQPLDLDALYKRTVEGVREVLRADRVIIYTFDADWNGTFVAESVAPGWTQLQGSQILDTCMKESKGGLYQKGRVCVINDVTQADLSSCHLEMLEKYQIKANLVVPLLKDDELLGLLIAQQCDQPRVWQPDEIDFLVQLSSILSLRLGRISFLEQKANAEQARSFSNVALRIRQSLDPEEVFKIAAIEIQKTLNVDRVVVCRLSQNLKHGTVIAESVVSGWQTMLGLQLDSFDIAEHYLEMFNNGYEHPIDNIPTEIDLKNTNITLTAQYKVKASLLAPIRIGKQMVGVIIAHQCSARRIWERSTLDLLEELAAQVGLAIEQATLLKSVATEAQRTQLLADFTSRIRQSFNTQDIFSTPVEEVQTILETDRVLIYRFNGDGKSGEITSQAIASDQVLADTEKLNKLFREENYQEYKTGSLWVTHDVYDSNLTPVHTRLLERLQIKASIVAPILANNQLVGLLCVHQCSTRRDWQQSEFYLLKQLAAQIGFALDQAKLIEQVKVVSHQQQQQTQELRNQLVNLVKDVEEATKGDLTVRADVTEGEIGTVADFFNAVVESLRRTVTQVKLATAKVNTSLEDNEGAVRQLADVAFKQAQETTRTLDSVEQMTRSIQEVAENAHHAAEVARTASETAEVGGEAMDRTVQKILSLRETVAETANKVKQLGESSQQISRVVALINQIAVQTNLLAINAGIEAARAGEGGQSFAIVAKEVGELAARSALATQEIEEIVETIQLETSKVIEAMERGTTQVVEGSHLAEDTKQSLNQILEVSRQIDQLVQSISGATVSQVTTSQAVTDLMKEIVRVSEQTSQSSNQISSSLQETVSVAQQLQASMEIFKVDT